ncbi:uncharacterized protein A1O9_06494 [Exophiala aquamarina CBS 119918]|uniref:Uncharacterized protein n=1 Tax=Exophiala aquamarina CBS 119918 TaxID=1182545 RepID=A0A072PGX9_9EURO|nr:uncharacterized protein A1O9_06494 [Exophiala aquamarina CBS 119918]KEF58568.1 hypothetical protein A1O9_06494 [Exophiala aquamarina CBS 119918]
MYSTLDDACICSTVRDLFDSSIPIALGTNPEDPGSPLTQFQQRDPGQDESVVQISDPEPSYIPPPKPDITPDLIAEALAIQPQNTATVSSIIPYFKSGIFKVFIQLNGPVAVTIVVNASVSLPCDSIGLADPQPNVALVPKVVHEGQGVNQTVIADCEVIAVNMYNPQVITYWIQKIADGTLYSVVSSNKVRDIDKMDTSQSVALALVTLSGGEKRSLPHTAGLIAPEKRQIFAADCVVACPFYHMHMIQGTDGYCGCMFNSAEQEVKLTTRGIKEPDVYTTIMTAEACAAMICFNEGNKPAAFNPFTRTCWCYTQPTIDSNPSAWNG